VESEWNGEKKINAGRSLEQKLKLAGKGGKRVKCSSGERLNFIFIKKIFNEHN
jgi:hypothetical protein